MSLSDIKSSVEYLLAGREERYWMQSIFLERANLVCQISLNIPGYPKSLPGDDCALSFAFQQMQNRLGKFPVKVAALKNGAGKALLFPLHSREGAVHVKKCAIAVESDFPWSRLLDIDIRTHYGILSRTELGQSPRNCFFCDKPAFECAREQRHPMEALRQEATRLLSSVVDPAHPFVDHHFSSASMRDK